MIQHVLDNSVTPAFIDVPTTVCYYEPVEAAYKAGF